MPPVIMFLDPLIVYVRKDLPVKDVKLTLMIVSMLCVEIMEPVWIL